MDQEVNISTLDAAKKAFEKVQRAQEGLDKAITQLASNQILVKSATSVTFQEEESFSSLDMAKNKAAFVASQMQEQVSVAMLSKQMSPQRSRLYDKLFSQDA